MANKIDKSTVKKVAHLARVGLTEDEAERYQHDLTRIVNMVDTIQSVSTDDIEPMAHPFDATQRLRADAVTESPNRDTLQTCAPQTEDGFYLVPKVIE